MLFDMTFLENHWKFPVWVILRILGATHTIIWTIFCSGDIGKAVGRRRLRLAALKNETLVWLGNTIGDVTEDFRWLSKC